MSGKVLGCSKPVSMVSDRVGMSSGLEIVNLHSENTFQTMAFGANLAPRAGSSIIMFTPPKRWVLYKTLSKTLD